MYIEDLKPSPKPERHRLDRELSELLQELRVVRGEY